MLIDPNTPVFSELFGHTSDPSKYTSRLPSHQTYQNALSDPSLSTAYLSPDIASDSDLADVTNSQAVWDLAEGTQLMLRQVTVAADGIVNASNGLGRELFGGLQSAMTIPNYAGSIADQYVGPVLTSTTAGGGAGAASAAIAVGMTALSAMGPWGQAVAAIIGFASFLVRTFKKKGELSKLEEEERIRRIYEEMPPLQGPGEETDSDIVSSAVMPTLQTGSWTRLFSPRFDPRGEWVGLEREGGFAFGPGTKITGEVDAFGKPLEVLQTTDGVGYVPGFNKITSVVQVSMWPDDPKITHWREVGGHWPIQKTMVRDVGDFYVNTGRLCGVAWEWVTSRDNSQDLFKVHVGTEASDDDRCLHYRWKSYCQGGLDLLHMNAVEWANPRGTFGGRVKDPNDPQWLFGSAIGCVIGAWSCWKNQGKYVQEFPWGYDYSQMKGSMGAPLGCVVDPATMLVRAGGLPCVTTIYHTHIRKTLNRVRQRQVWTLRHTPACATVRRSWDAFKDEALVNILEQARRALLKHEIRFTISLDDVPEGETIIYQGQERDYKDLLRKSGVTRIPGPNRIKSSGNTGTLEPAKEPLPTVPGAAVAMPWSSEPRPLPFWRRPLVQVGAATALGVGAFTVYRRRNR